MAGTIDSIHVLHVDDKLDFAELTATFLEREDDRFTVDTAPSASEARAHLDETAYDCVVSDHDMPGQNGIEFLKEVREVYPDLPFILYTGKGSEEVASDAISAGVTEYIQKESGSSQYTVLANRIRNAVEKYHAQTELADREKRLNLFFEQSPLGVIEWDENFNFVRLNDAAEQILGYSEDAVVGRSWEVIVPDSEQEPVDDVVSDLLENSGGYRSVNENIRENGERIVCEWHNRVVSDDSGDVVAVFSQFQDITEKEERKAELQRSERRYKAVFNDPNILVGLLEPDGTVVDINQTAMDYIDPTLDEITGEPFWETPWFDQAEGIQQAVKERVNRAADGEYVEFEADLVRPTGDPYTVEGVFRPVANDDGEVVSLLISTRDITERKERERDLQQYEAYLEESSDIITVLDEDGIITYQSPAVERILGYEPEELVGRNGFDLIHPDDVDEVHDTFIDLSARPGETATVEGRFEASDGEWHWLEIRGTNQLGHDAINGIVTNNRDITERKAHQRELEQTNTVLSTLFETLPVGILAEDADRNVLAVNDHLFDLFELPGSPEEIDGEDCEQIAEQVSELFVDSSQFVERINELVTTREPTDNEEIALQDGRTFERSYRPIELPDGDGHLWVYKDISEQKEQWQRYEAVFNHTYQFTGLLKPDGRVLEANDTVLEFSGLDREDVLGQKVWEAQLFPHSTESRDPVKSAVERAADGEFVRHELVIQGANREAVVDFSMRPVTDKQGNVILLVPEGREITERKERERALQRERDRLDEFSGVVSHDLQSPLNVAKGRLELAQEECDSEHLAAIETALDRIERITGDVLWLAREGRDVGSMDAIVLLDTIESAWSIASDRAAHTELRYAGDDLSTVTIEADDDRLCQLLENLFRNAIEHGGDDVTVTVGTVDDGFYVEDDGPGIPADRRDDVFSAGYSTSEEGTGFGLSIVKQIVEAHGWEIHATENAKGGARFEITGVEFVTE